MTAERWSQIKQLFEGALEQPAVDREAFVLAQTEQDAELRHEALAMLRNSGNEEGLLDLGMLARDWVMPLVTGRALRPNHILAGRYRIIRPIGAGGMGEVYEAEDLDLGARVAVKTVRVEHTDAPAQLKREIQLARTVTHPNVCRLFDMHRHHESESGQAITFLTMELVEGETLAAYLAGTGPLSPTQALPIVRQIAAALAAAHECKVVHRDLKPGNVILTPDGARAVVTDFGLSHPLAQATASSVTITGTPAYMAPEQFEGKPATVAADIYAFGVVLYEMMVGRRPFHGETPIALALEKIRNEAPQASEAVPGLPLEWNAVIRRCLDPKPERRFVSIKDAIRQLEESVNRPRRFALTRRQKKSLVGSMAITGLLAVAAWRYYHSAYTPGREALRLYRLGVHTHQLDLPWKASQLFERAIESDSRFVSACVSLAQTWMDLDQPLRARAELQHAAEIRTRWRRVARHDALLEEAANARMRGDLGRSAILHRQATAAAPETEKFELLFEQARAHARAGDVRGALSEFASLTQGRVCNGTAMLQRAILTYPQNPVAARSLFDQTANCFEAAGDLDGVAETCYKYAHTEWFQGRTQLDRIRSAIEISKSSGNVEQQILAAGLLSEFMLETGDDEAAYVSFAQAMQLADVHGLRFFSARLLNDRADHFFKKEDFLQSGHFGDLAASVSRSGKMPWTLVRCDIRSAKVSMRMSLPERSLLNVAEAQEQLKLYPNSALSAELASLTQQIKHTPKRPEGSVYSTLSR